jgi:hypothetical protein
MVTKLKRHDHFEGGTEDQYRKISKACMRDADPLLVEMVVQNCVTRGACFWSERLNNIVSGKLSSGNRLKFNEFFERLKNTLEK